MSAIFAYGTLMFPEVLSALCGQEYPHQVVALHGFARYQVAGQIYPGIIRERGALTVGHVYCGLDVDALRVIDQYEGEFYDRRRLFLKVSAHLLLPAYAYIVPERFAHRLTDKSWDHKQFTRHRRRLVQLCQGLRLRYEKDG